MGFLNTAKITAIDILRESYNYLKKEYELSDSTFTPASPFGMILGVLANIAELIFLYIEHVAAESNINRAQTPESVYGLSRLTGHDPYRGSAAFGVLRLKMNPAALNEFDGTYVKIPNGIGFTIKDTGVFYHLNMLSEYITIHPGADPIEVEFIQGSPVSQTVIANGKALQSFNINVRGNTDHDRIRVYVNNEEYKKVDSLYDMNYDEKCFMVKSSINFGLSVFFGTGDFGHIPEAGSVIKVDYINHVGAAGNYDNPRAYIEFNGVGYDDNGDEVDLTKALSVMFEQTPTMGSYNEPLSMTRLIAPKTSKSMVLATPDNYIAFLSRYSQFSFVNAYNTKEDQYLDDDNVIYLQILPNIANKVSVNSSTNDYFTLNEEDFVLSESEKNGIIKVLDDSGQQLISTVIHINDITVKKYALVVVIKYFEKYDKSALWTKVRSKLNTYFLNINRTDMIPKSDVISIIENIEGVDSVNAFFISKENEDAIRNGYYYKTYYIDNPDTHIREKHTERIILEDGEDPKLGLDGFGDIKINENEVAIINGGWSDRYGNNFMHDVRENQLGGLTILFSHKTDNNLYNRITQEKLNNILNGK